jgi:hypothetical protein
MHALMKLFPSFDNAVCQTRSCDKIHLEGCVSSATNVRSSREVIYNLFIYLFLVYYSMTLFSN